MGAHFEGLDEDVFVAALKSIGYFFLISIFPETKIPCREICIEKAYNVGERSLQTANTSVISRSLVANHLLLNQ